jgi:hypothetical protein
VLWGVNSFTIVTQSIAVSACSQFRQQFSCLICATVTTASTAAATAAAAAAAAAAAG